MKLSIKDSQGNPAGELEVKFELIQNGRGSQAVHDTVVAFMAGWTVQALYLLWTDHVSRIGEPEAVSGRRQSVYAFTGYTAATGIVLWLPTVGVLG